MFFRVTFFYRLGPASADLRRLVPLAAKPIFTVLDNWQERRTKRGTADHSPRLHAPSPRLSLNTALRSRPARLRWRPTRNRCEKRAVSPKAFGTSAPFWSVRR